MTSAFDPSDWIQRDLASVWHPCTQMAEHPDVLPIKPIVRGQGEWLYGPNGERYLDAVSSWWTNLFGHGEPRIAKAIAEQAMQLEHVIYAGFSHQPGLQLAEALIALTPPNLQKVFYADNGSAGVEVALKMSFHSFHNRGQNQRTRFVALENGYHGETIGALSMGDIPLYRRVYAPLLLEPLFAPSPDAYRAEAGESAEQFALRQAQKLDALFAQHGDEICALILEPLIQCAGSMRMHHPVYLREARRICDRYGAHLILDEIAVGFGRTGTMFAHEQAQIAPDFLCLSKGLTGGFLPLAAVLTTNEVYEAFLSESRERAFLHSHSYTGNPLACAAALASLSIFSSDDVLTRNTAKAAALTKHAEKIRSHPRISDVRQTGMVLAFEMSNDQHKTPLPSEHRAGLRAYRYALENGVLLRPLGDVLYWMPPYCISEESMQHLADVTLQAIDEATRTCA
jgi:adenosylmethionine---8-amino-7-oxononanoate aminotransferase